MKTSAAIQPAVLVRRIAPSDSIAEVTSLLHRAYRPQVEMGLRPLAGRQTEDVTRRRADESECFVATLEQRIVGVILLNEKEETDFPKHFLKPHVAHFSQFGVDPSVQGRGVGVLLLDTVERRAREIGETELALSMAEPDAELRRFYDKRGFQFVEYWQWPYTNYRSVILSRPVTT